MELPSAHNLKIAGRGGTGGGTRSLGRASKAAAALGVGSISLEHPWVCGKLVPFFCPLKSKLQECQQVECGRRDPHRRLLSLMGNSFLTGLESIVSWGHRYKITKMTGTVTGWVTDH